MIPGVSHADLVSPTKAMSPAIAVMPQWCRSKLGDRVENVDLDMRTHALVECRLVHDAREACKHSRGRYRFR